MLRGLPQYQPKIWHQSQRFFHLNKVHYVAFVLYSWCIQILGFLQYWLLASAFFIRKYVLYQMSSKILNRTLCDYKYFDIYFINDKLYKISSNNFPIPFSKILTEYRPKAKSGSAWGKEELLSIRPKQSLKLLPIVEIAEKMIPLSHIFTLEP